MKRKTKFILLSSMLILSACGNNQNKMNGEIMPKAVMDQAIPMKGISTQGTMNNVFRASDSYVSNSKASSAERVTEMKTAANQSSSSSPVQLQKQMIIYNASLSIRVKDFQDTLKKMETLVKLKGGYIVQSYSSGSEQENKNGNLQVRIPQQNLNSFLEEAEKMSEKVLSRTIQGEDVTEEYVDLESRIKAKKILENRLTDFLQKANKTEDMLRISNDLSRVQEEIEGIEGRMKYLTNKSDFSTVEVSVEENKVIIPNIQEKNENVLDLIQKEFMNNVGFLFGFASSVLVFLLGNSPTLIILSLVGCVIYRFFKKRKKMKQEKLEG